MGADQLSYRLKLRTNGIKQSLARRNKFHMGEAVRKAGATLAHATFTMQYVMKCRDTA
jgi:hypothetical protein